MGGRVRVGPWGDVHRGRLSDQTSLQTASIVPRTQPRTRGSPICSVSNHFASMNRVRISEAFRSAIDERVASRSNGRQSWRLFAVKNALDGQSDARPAAASLGRGVVCRVIRQECSHSRASRQIGRIRLSMRHDGRASVSFAASSGCPDWLSAIRVEVRLRVRTR